MYGDITFFTILFKYSGVQTVKEMLVQRPANVTLRDTADQLEDANGVTGCPCQLVPTV
jgi:hypothetical protein